MAEVKRRISLMGKELFSKGISLLQFNATIKKLHSSELLRLVQEIPSCKSAHVLLKAGVLCDVMEMTTRQEIDEGIIYPDRKSVV